MTNETSRLILIRHSIPTIDSSRPAATWRLSESGRNAATAIAFELSGRGIRSVISSEEPKATETATIIADSLEIPLSSAPGLHEHERGQLDWHDEEAWYALIRRFFERPNEVVFGYESANESLARFKTAIEDVLIQPAHQLGTIAVVSHGTVMSLYVADQTGDDPYSIWNGLRMPDHVELP